MSTGLDDVRCENGYYAEDDFNDMYDGQQMGVDASAAGAAYQQQQSAAVAPVAAAAALDANANYLMSVAAAAIHAYTQESAGGGAASAKPLTENQKVVTKSIAVPFSYDASRDPVVVALDKNAFESMFGDENIDFNSTFYLRSIGAAGHLKTAPYELGVRIRGHDANNPEKVITNVAKFGSQSGGFTHVLRTPVSDAQRTLWTNTSDPAKVEQHAGFDYHKAIKQMEPITTTNPDEAVEGYTDVNSELGRLILANEAEIASAENSDERDAHFNQLAPKRLQRLWVTHKGGAKSMMVVANKERAREVLDNYYDNYLKDLVTSNVAKSPIFIELVRPDHSDEDIEKGKRVHEFDHGDPGATVTTVNSAAKAQRAVVELSFSLVKMA